MPSESIIANKTINVDSPRNCTINCFRFAPVTFLMAISLARCVAFAVVRIVKLIQPIKRMSRDMAAKDKTTFILPPALDISQGE